MVIQLPLILPFTLLLSHLLEPIKHTRHNLIIRLVDILSDLQRVRTNKLVLQLANVRREVLDEGCNTLPLLTGELGLFDRLDMVSLKAEQFSDSFRVWRQLTYYTTLEHSLETCVLLLQ